MYRRLTLFLRVFLIGLLLLPASPAAAPAAAAADDAAGDADADARPHFFFGCRRRRQTGALSAGRGWFRRWRPPPPPQTHVRHRGDDSTARA